VGAADWTRDPRASPDPAKRTMGLGHTVDVTDGVPDRSSGFPNQDRTADDREVVRSALPGASTEGLPGSE